MDRKEIAGPRSTSRSGEPALSEVEGDLRFLPALTQTLQAVP